MRPQFSAAQVLVRLDIRQIFWFLIWKNMHCRPHHQFDSLGSMQPFPTLFVLMHWAAIGIIPHLWEDWAWEDPLCNVSRRQSWLGQDYYWLRVTMICFHILSIFDVAQPRDTIEGHGIASDLGVYYLCHITLWLGLTMCQPGTVDTSVPKALLILSDRFTMRLI